MRRVSKLVQRRKRLDQNVASLNISIAKKIGWLLLGATLGFYIDMITIFAISKFTPNPQPLPEGVALHLFLIYLIPFILGLLLLAWAYRVEPPVMTGKWQLSILDLLIVTFLAGGLMFAWFGFQ